MKSLRKKSSILIVAVISTLVLVAIIASLGGLAFKPAKPFVFRQASNPTPNAHTPSPEVPFYIFIVVMAVLLGAIFFLLPPEARKKYLWTLVRLILAGVVIFLILSQISLGTNNFQPPQNGGNPVTTLRPGATGTAEPEVTPAEYIPPKVSPWLSYAVGLAFLLIFVGIFGWVVRRRMRAGVPYEELAEIARSALKDLEAGRDWGDTVLTCYYRMTKAVESWRGIHRRASMTPAEFADHLASTGLPHGAVHRLTSLFEKVRYGGRKSTRRDVKEASECLTAILDFCEGTQ